MDKQFETTSRFFTIKFSIYVVLYCIPMFLYFMFFEKQPDKQVICLISSFIVSIALFVYEIL